MEKIIFLFLLFIANTALPSEPVNLSATKDVKKVLDYLTGLKGKGILTGQQNLATDVMKWTHEVVEITGKYPALLGEDFSYGDETPAKRLNIVNAAVDQWKNGGLITISWHQVNPDTWNGSSSEGSFQDTQKRMTAEQFNKLLSDTTSIHKKYLEHIDTIATYLKMLRDSGVVILWRPYHEMNGDWFWWGNKTNFRELWKIMFDRYTTYHQLNNLIWVWSPNIGHSLSDYYPGDDYVDIIGLDGYTGGQRNWDKDTALQKDIDEIKSLSKNGVISFTELGWLPDMDWLETQRPEFVWFLCWWTHLEAENTKEWIRQVYHHYYAINRDRVHWNSNP
jgi:mannan endo-1,4-beta-mannosidase